jgi:hypothetical protein
MTTEEFQTELKALNNARLYGDLTEKEYQLAVAKLEVEFRAEYVSPAEY